MFLLLKILLQIVTVNQKNEISDENLSIHCWDSNFLSNILDQIKEGFFLIKKIFKKPSTCKLIILSTNLPNNNCHQLPKS